MSTPLHMLSVSDLHDGYSNGAFSAREVVESSLRAIKANDVHIHAFLELTADDALAAADALDQRFKTEGAREVCDMLPLAGVPIAFKDNLNLKGTHTTCSSKMLENYISPYTATCVERTLNAGAISMGKLNMDEFAFGSSTETSAFGPTHNPWDLARVPGGSSGGSAAALAAGFVPLALGSDTGGSIRQPASFCGVVGAKPTYGVVSRYGVVAFGSSLDQVGPFARSVEDAALLQQVISGRDSLDCTSQDIDTTAVTRSLHRGVEGMRIGIVPEFMNAEGLHAEVREKIVESAEHLKAAGVVIREVSLPHAQAAMSAYYVLGPCEAFSNLARFDSVRYGYAEKGDASLGKRYEDSRATGFGIEAKRRIMLGSYLLSSGVYEDYYVRAQKIRTLITRDYEEAFSQVDCILAPASPRTAFAFGEISDPLEMYLSDMFTVSINIAGNGGMSVPVGFGAQSGLPVGAQLISPAFKDENMYRVAYALQNAYGVAPIAPCHFEGGAE